MQRVAQYQKWTGEIRPPMPTDAEYLVPVLYDRDITSNEQLWSHFRYVNDQAQKLSALPWSGIDLMTKDLAKVTLDCINRCFSDLNIKTVSMANRVFTSTFGGPRPYQYVPAPIRWTGESEWGLRIIGSFVGCLFQTPQVHSNRLDQGVTEHNAGIIAEPLFALKAQMMKELFQIEIMGEISPEELAALFRDSPPLPPMIRSPGDRRDTRADTAAQDTAAMSDETIARPTLDRIEAAQSGVEVWQWVPSDADWAVFGESIERMAFDAPNQPSIYPIPFSDVAIGAGAPATA